MRQVVLLLLLSTAVARAQDVHLPIDDGLTKKLREADAARDAGRLDEALDLYRLVLDRDAGTYHVALVEGEKPRRRWIGLTEWALRSLAALPPDGAARLRERWAKPAAEAAAAARVASDSRTALARVRERFPLPGEAPGAGEELEPVPAGPGLRLPRGDAANRGVVDVDPALGSARFERELDPEWTGLAQCARHQPLLHDGRVLLATADQVLAFDVATGEPAPRVPRLGPTYADTNPKVQFSGAIVGDTLVVPLVSEVTRDQQYRGIPIKVKIPLRKLAAFDLAAWTWTWNHGASLKGTQQADWSFAPPTAAGDTLFAPSTHIQGLVNSHVSAVDARTGAVRWSTWVVSGQVELTMLGEQATEPLCTPVAVSDGTVFHATSFGVVAALDARTGRTRWVTEYPQLEIKAARGYYPDPRQIVWENNAPIVEDGVVVAAPMDSTQFVGLDAVTGAVLWTWHQRPSAEMGEMKYLLCAARAGDQGLLVVAGMGEVRCLELRTGKLLWTVPLRGRTVAGRGCIARGAVLVPLDRDEVVLFELATGKRLRSAMVGATGNVMLVGQHALITGAGKLAVHRVGR